MQPLTQRLRGDYEYDTLENYLKDISPVFAERNVGGALYRGNAINQAVFGTDQFRLRSNLTINVGLRWDYQGIPADDKQQVLNAISSLPGVLDFKHLNQKLVGRADTHMGGGVDSAEFALEALRFPYRQVFGDVENPVERLHDVFRPTVLIKAAAGEGTRSLAERFERGLS